MLKSIETKIDTTIKKIKNKIITPADSGIGKMFAILKQLDEPSYEEHINKYKEALGKLKK
jgi:hypothetical protein